MPKLTLSIDEKVVRGAKRYDVARGTSVSRLVERYLDFLSRPFDMAAAPPVLPRCDTQYTMALPMPGDPYYHTSQWRRLRTTVLQRDAYTCIVPGCRQRATTVDHIVSRRNGGADEMRNLRSLCSAHDRQIKEMRDGRRANGGILTQLGSGIDGTPMDLRHHWNGEGGGKAKS